MEDHDHDYYFICEIKPDAKALGDMDSGIGKLIRYKYELRKQLKKKGKEGDVITILVSRGDTKYWSTFCPHNLLDVRGKNCLENLTKIIEKTIPIIPEVKL